MESNKSHKIDKYHQIHILRMKTLKIKKLPTNEVIEKKKTKAEVVDVLSWEGIIEKEGGVE